MPEQIDVSSQRYNLPDMFKESQNIEENMHFIFGISYKIQVLENVIDVLRQEADSELKVRIEEVKKREILKKMRRVSVGQLTRKPSPVTSAVTISCVTQALRW